MTSLPDLPDPLYVPGLSDSKKLMSRFSPKFALDVPCLITGEAKAAAMGLDTFLKLQKDKLSQKHDNALNVIRQEFLERLSAEQDIAKRQYCLDILAYILDREAIPTEEMSNDGHSTVVRDERNRGKTLTDFAQMEQAQKTHLSVAEVAALRIYSSKLFTYINAPFREENNQSGFEDPHPVGFTVLLIFEALKKLRQLHARDREQKVCFWRGLKDMRVPKEFLKHGGTELQCMSTTTDIEVAGQYAQSKHPLILCVHCTSFMNRGSDISWVSMYAHEKEILYPPLTFLKVLGMRKIHDCEGGYIVDVEPVIG